MKKRILLLVLSLLLLAPVLLTSRVRADDGIILGGDGKSMTQPTRTPAPSAQTQESTLSVIVEIGLALLTSAIK
jgi:hypothetical protein